MNQYPREELFRKRIPIYKAEVGKEYAFLLPGQSYRLDPQRMFFAKLLEVDIDDTGLFADPFMRLKVEVSPEFREAWGLDDPVLEWARIRSSLPVYEIPESRTRRGFARNLALMNAKAKLPIEMLGEIMKFETPTFKGGPYPGKERQKAHWTAEHERQSNDALAAMKAGRRKTRRIRRSQTRRRK